MNSYAYSTTNRSMPGGMGIGAGRRFWQAPATHEIKYGDRIYVRVVRDGRTLLEFSVNNADSFTDLIGEIRYAGRHIVGLTSVFIRNHSRGWSETRPIKFYAEGGIPRRHQRSSAYAAARPATSYSTLQSRPSHMSFPWETH